MAESDESTASTESPSSERSEASTPSQTNIEELQELKSREGNQAAKEQAVRQLLSILDPHPNDHALTYQAVLGRLENVIARDIQQAGD